MKYKPEKKIRFALYPKQMYERLSDIREETGATFRELGILTRKSKCGVNISYVKLKKGEKSITLTTFIKYSYALAFLYGINGELESWDGRDLIEANKFPLEPDKEKEIEIISLDHIIYGSDFGKITIPQTGIPGYSQTTFGENVRRYNPFKTLAELAERLWDDKKCKQKRVILSHHIDKNEENKEGISLQTFHRICKTLRVPPDVLLFSNNG